MVMSMQSTQTGIRSHGGKHNRHMGLSTILLVIGLLSIGFSLSAQRQTLDKVAHPPCTECIRGMDTKFVGIQDAKRSTQGRNAKGTMLSAVQFGFVGGGQDVGKTVRLVGIQDALRSIHSNKLQISGIANPIPGVFRQSRHSKNAYRIAVIQDSLECVSGGQLQYAVKPIEADPTFKFALANRQNTEVASIGNL